MPTEFQKDPGQAVEIDHDPIPNSELPKESPDLVYIPRNRLFSLKGVKQEELRDVQAKLHAMRCRWATVPQEKGFEVIYYSWDEFADQAQLPHLMVAIGLRFRAVGLDKMPLSADEWSILLKAYGKSEEECRKFRDSVLKKQNSAKVETEYFDALLSLPESRQQLYLDHIPVAKRLGVSPSALAEATRVWSRHKAASLTAMLERSVNTPPAKTCREVTTAFNRLLDAKGLLENTKVKTGDDRVQTLIDTTTSLIHEVSEFMRTQESGING